MSWKKARDPLFRGDDAGGVSVPDPTATLGIVPHVLYPGAGRRSPFHSTSESEDSANHFAGHSGRVYRTAAPKAEALGVAHVGQIELKKLLVGKGHGRAAWRSALEVMQARRYVEQWAEHLLDFSNVDPGDAARVAREVYDR